MATVTYTGEDAALNHHRPGGRRYTFFRGQPLEIGDKDDIAFYREKETRGSPFRVEPKLVKEVVKEKSFPIEKTETKTSRKSRTGKKSSATPSRRTPTNTPTNTPKSKIFI